MQKRYRPRHRIGVPKGILRHLALKILDKHPMSGSELMDQIQGYTDWRPSPGSIYPLLAQLLEEKLIEPYHDEDPGLKRFKLADEGILLMEEHGNYDEQITKRYKTIHKMYWILHREMPEDLYESFLDFMNTVEKTFEKTTKSTAALECFKEILVEASLKLLEIGA
jgi:DNA-binding PadR family transcriptional regulator